MFFLRKNIPTYLGASQQIKDAKLRNDTVRENFFLADITDVHVILCDHITSRCI